VLHGPVDPPPELPELMPPLLPELPLPPELEPLPTLLHSLAQLWSAHVTRFIASLSQPDEIEHFVASAFGGQAQEKLEEHDWFAAVTWLLQLEFRQLAHDELLEIPMLGQLVAE
jgi:hypothetical protein